MPDDQCVGRARNETEGAHGQDKRVACVVKGCVLLLEGEGCHNTANVTEAEHPGGADGPLTVTAQVHDIPADDVPAHSQRAHAGEAEARVFCGESLHTADLHAHGDAGDQQAEVEEDERGPHTHPVGQDG